MSNSLFDQIYRMTVVIPYLVLVLACTIPYIGVLASDYFREFLFYNKPDHILFIPSGLVNATEMTRSKATDKMACVFACTRSRPLCKSVNFKIQPENDSTHICELLSIDMYTKPSYLKPAQGFTHLSIKNKCDPNPCQNNGLCCPDYDNGEYHCVCNATKGKDCEIFYSDCSELRSAGYTADGVYHIDPDGKGSFKVYCDMTTDGGGWTVLQRRDNNLVSFTRGWQDYKTGFGNLSSEFWLGLEKVYRLTKRQVTKLRIDLEAPTGNKGYAVYSSFSISDESDFYRLSASGYSGTAGDPLTAPSHPNYIANNRRFSTPDKDNDACPCHCGVNVGWWWGWCGVSCLNTRTWNTFGQIFRTEMKLK